MKGSRLKLKCIFSGNPAPEVSWAKVLGGNDLPKKRTRFNSFNQEIEIRRVEFGDQGEYQCTVSLDEGYSLRHMLVSTVRAGLSVSQPINICLLPCF